MNDTKKLVRNQIIGNIFIATLLCMLSSTMTFAKIETQVFDEDFVMENSLLAQIFQNTRLKLNELLGRSVVNSLGNNRYQLILYPSPLEKKIKRYGEIQFSISKVKNEYHVNYLIDGASQLSYSLEFNESLSLTWEDFFLMNFSKIHKIALALHHKTLEKPKVFKIKIPFLSFYFTHNLDTFNSKAKFHFLDIDFFANIDRLFEIELQSAELRYTFFYPHQPKPQTHLGVKAISRGHDELPQLYFFSNASTAGEITPKEFYEVFSEVQKTFQMLNISFFERLRPLLTVNFSE